MTTRCKPVFDENKRSNAGIEPVAHFGMWRQHREWHLFTSLSNRCADCDVEIDANYRFNHYSEDEVNPGAPTHA